MSQPGTVADKGGNNLRSEARKTHLSEHEKISRGEVPLSCKLPITGKT